MHITIEGCAVYKQTATPGHTPHPPSSPGLLLGRYRIMSSSGTGGFGSVLTCWDTRLQRRVAIKRMPLALPGIVAPGASTLSEALNEARTSSMLAHPHIVTMFDFETDQQVAYLVMEYVDGLTLNQLLDRVEGGTLTNEECSYMVRCVASALAFAHDNGVLHLDIKPSNIIFDYSGNIKLCDFGMATLASATGYGDARGGTVGYMPPEQIEGSVVDERSDIFSLAVVVWQAITGKNPFLAATAEESLKKIERGPQRKLSKLDPNLAGMAEEVIMSALSVQAQARIPSMQAFSDELTFALGDPEEGAQSIRELMAQAVEDDAEDVIEHDRRALPLAWRYPWLGTASTRVVVGVASLIFGLQILPVLINKEELVLLWSAVYALASAFWPPLGSLAAIGIISSSFLFTPQQQAQEVLIGVACGAVGFSWWIKYGRRLPLATAALLIPIISGQANLALSLSSFAFTSERSDEDVRGSHAPVPHNITHSAVVLGAAATAGLIVVLTQLMSSARHYNFSIDALTPSLLSSLTQASTLLHLMAIVCGTALSVGVERWRGSTHAAIIGQILGFSMLVIASFAEARMENAEIWTSGNLAQLCIALFLVVLVCIAIKLRGPLNVDGEIE